MSSMEIFAGSIVEYGEGCLLTCRDDEKISGVGRNYRLRMGKNCRLRRDVRWEDEISVRMGKIV